MKYWIQPLALAAIALCLSGCAATTLKQTWKSPASPAAPFEKVAVVAVDDRGDVRVALENRFVQVLEKGGQPAQHLRGVLGLREMKSDKEAAAARLREAGMDAILIIRLVDQATYVHETVVSPGLHAGGLPVDESFGWYEHYCVAFAGMGVSYGSSTRNIWLETSLHELKTGGRVWSGLTSTVLKPRADALLEADAIAAKVVKALRKDGLVR